MKEIKLRIWDKTYKRFYYMTITKDGVARTMNPNEPVGELSSTELCSGLKDKNGKEIFEGDIVKLDDGSIIAQIIWRPEHAQFMLWTIRERFMHPMNDHFMLSFEVIGNIYENPELLEGSKIIQYIDIKHVSLNQDGNFDAGFEAGHDPREEI